MRQKIHEALRTLCIPAHQLGYRYIESALHICMDDPRAISDMGGLYVAIAYLHETTPGMVERAIRHAIETAFNCIPRDVAAQIISPYAYEHKPTNSQFLAAVVEWLRLEEGAA